MSKKFKLYIPLVNFKNRGFTLIKAEKINSLQELLPKEDEILMNLNVQKGRIERGLEYNPLVRKLSKEKFTEIEKEIRKFKSNHIFLKKSFDVISGNDLNSILVQFTQI